MSLRKLLLLTLVLAGCGGGKQSTTAPSLYNAPPAKAAGTGLYDALLVKGAKWELTSRAGEEPDENNIVTAEVADVRKLGDASVVSIHWAHNGDASGASGRDHLPEMIAITPAGMWLFDPGTSDADITAALAGTPTLADPPEEMEPTAENGHHFVANLKIDGEPAVCWGHARDQGDDCEDTCTGEVCIARGKGIVSIGGTSAPDFDYYLLRGMKSP